MSSECKFLLMFQRGNSLRCPTAPECLPALLLPNLYAQSTTVTLRESEPQEGEQPAISPPCFLAQPRGDDVEPRRKADASAPLKLRLSFTTGCSSPSFHTATTPHAPPPTTNSHSATQRYEAATSDGMKRSHRGFCTGGVLGR